MGDERVSGVYPLKFYPKVASALDQATITMAVSLWRAELDRNDSARFDDICVNLTECGRIPKQVDELLEKAVLATRESMSRWVSRYVSDVLCGDWDYEANEDANILRRHFDDLVWQADGSIDEYATAKAMVAGDALTTVQKFGVACLYCMETEVKRIWASMSESARDTTFSEDSLSYYWRCYLRGELDTVERPVEGMSLEHFIIRFGNGNNWPAIEYMWSRAQPHERVQEAVYLIRHVGSTCAANMLQKLNEVELDGVLEEASVDVIKSLMSEPKWWEFAFRTWSYMCDKMDGGKFARVLSALFGDVRRLCHEFNICVNVEAFLFELWKSSPERLKEVARRDHASDLVEALSRGMQTDYDHREGRDARLLAELLTGNETAANERIWRASYASFMENIRPAWLDKMMRLCFDTEEEANRFKREVMMKRANLRRFMWIWRRRDDTDDELVTFLRCYRNDKQALQQLCTEILYAASRENHADGCLDMLGEFFDDERDEQQFKREFAELPATSQCLHELVDRRDFDMVRYAMRVFVTDPSMAEAMKTELHRRCCRLYQDKAFRLGDVSDLREFLTWSWSGPGNVAELKSGLEADNVYEVFLTHLRAGGEEYVDDYLYEGVDEFLHWLLGSPEEAMKYKLDKVNEYKKDELLSGLLRHFRDDEDAIERLLAWFFGEGDERVGKFKEELRRSM